MIGKVKLTYEFTYRPQDISEDKNISYNEFLSTIDKHIEATIIEIDELTGLVPVKIETVIKEQEYRL